MTVDNTATCFHAGRFLSELLGRSNMDAALFVQMGEAVAPDFLQRLEAVMFEGNEIR